MTAYEYDFLVIGAGSGGVRASRIAAQLGAKVAVAEESRLGGTCVNVGCVPKKLFVYGSHFSEEFAAAAGYGWHVPEPSFDWPTLRDNKSQEIERLNGVYRNLLINAGVDILQGRATLVDPHTVQIGDRQVTAERVLIAVGGWPSVPDMPGKEHMITSNEVFYLDSFPRDVIVLGGGYIAVEFAGIFHGLGANAELVYRGAVPLRGFDEDVRSFVTEQIREKGITVSCDVNIEAIEKLSSGRFSVTLTDGSHREVDCVLAATGRHPKLDGLGLENTQVKLTEKGYIEVDDNYQTAEPSIYAVGDVTGGLELTPVALAEGMALARNLFGPGGFTVDYSNIPTAVFCQPNIATVGMTEDEARKALDEVVVFKTAFRHMKNTLSGSPEKTFMKLLVEKASDRVVGCHMVGAEAGEIIQGIAVAMKAGATKADFDNTIGIHPTAAEEFVTLREPAN